VKLITGHGLDDVLAWRPSGPVRVREFLADAQAVAAVLPGGGGVLNLCEDRYHFAVLFAACLLTGRPSLQPSSHSAETLQRLAQDHPGCFAVVDGPFDVAGLPGRHFPTWRRCTRTAVTEFPRSMTACGGDPVHLRLHRPAATHAKTWGRLVQNGRAEARALGLDRRPMCWWARCRCSTAMASSRPSCWRCTAAAASGAASRSTRRTWWMRWLAVPRRACW
jgi:hypothetical protein